MFVGGEFSIVYKAKKILIRSFFISANNFHYLDSNKTRYTFIMSVPAHSY